MDRMASIRARIRTLAKASGVSRREFSRRAGLKSETHLGLIISGTTKGIELRTLQAIAEAGNVTLEYLLTGRADPVAETGLDLDSHPQEDFAPAARAFLELYRCSAEAVAIVRKFFTVRTSAPLSSEEWFEELRMEYRRETRRISFAAPRSS